MDLRVDLGDDLSEVLRIGVEAVILHVDDQQLALVVGLDPGLITLIEALEVIDADGVLIVTSALGDLLHQLVHRSLQVDEQIGRRDGVVHVLEQPEVVLEVARGHQPHRMQVGREDVGVLVDGAVLDHIATAAADLQQLLEARVEEEDLQVEAPPLHVLVEVEQVGVVVHGLLQLVPLVMFGQELGEGGLSGADIACDGDVHDGSVDDERTAKISPLAGAGNDVDKSWLSERTPRCPGHQVRRCVHAPPAAHGLHRRWAVPDCPSRSCACHRPDARPG